MHLKQLNKTVNALCLAMLALTMFGCQHSETYYHFSEIQDAQWAASEVLQFDIDSSLVAPHVPYDITIEVTNNINYPYQNIWLFVESNLRNDSVYDKTSKEYLLADKKGKWMGAGFGALHQSSLLLEKGIRLDEKRNYTIKISHAMRDDRLVGIEKVGIKVSKQE